MRIYFSFLLLAAGCSAQTVVTIDASSTAAGVRIPPRFTGLSFETKALTSTTGFPAENAIFQRLVAQLGAGVLRVGGNSDDETIWQPGARSTSDPQTILRTTDIDRLFAFARTTGWNVLWSLNLGSGTSAQAADEASYVQKTYGPLLLGFEIGNEPDLYYKNAHRTAAYTETDYLAEWKSFADAVLANVPGAPLTGPAAAGSYQTWTAQFAAVNGPRIGLLTQHEYATGPLASVAATASNSATIPHLLSDSIRATADNEAKGLTQIAQKAGLPWRMAEANSCYNGGQDGVSNTFAAALWVADWMFTLASEGSTGVNLHGGGAGLYTPIAWTVSGNNVQMSARPIYYGMLLFRAAARGRIVPSTVKAGGVNLTSYAILDDDGTRRVVVFNKDAAQDATVRITAGAAYRTASILRLKAASLDATSGVTIGGSTVQADGTWSPAATETVAVVNGVAEATVGTGSGAVFLFGNGALSIANSAGGQAVIAPESLATAYGQGLSFVEQSATPPLPSALAGVQLNVKDSAGVARPASVLYVSPSQVNFEVPAGTAVGTASISIAGASGTVQTATIAPGLYSLGGANVAAATAFRIVNGTSAQQPLAAFDCSSGVCFSVPLILDDASTIYVTLYGTGIRGAAGALACTVGGTVVPVLFAGAQGQFAGLDQVNISLPGSLRGRGDVDVVCSAGSQSSNTVRIKTGG